MCSVPAPCKRAWSVFWTYCRPLHPNHFLIRCQFGLRVTCGLSRASFLHAGPSPAFVLLSTRCVHRALASFARFERPPLLLVPLFQQVSSSAHFFFRRSPSLGLSLRLSRTSAVPDEDSCSSFAGHVFCDPSFLPCL